MKKARAYPEDDLQMAVATYLDYMGFLWCHVANERRTSIRAGARLKKKGVKKGVPDCLIFEPNSDYSGLAIELKIKGNSTTEEQKDWLKKLIEKGWDSCVCYNLDEVINKIQLYASK